MDRIAEIADNLIGIESPDDLMLEILEALPQTETIPEAGNYYTFVYQPKTPNVRYDEFPLVAVTNVFGWGEKEEDGNGLTLRLSLFNNDRLPNCTAILAGDSFVVLARRKIREGEELCISYGPQYDSFLFE